MSGDEVQVDPADLTGKAAQIRGLSWSSQTAQPALISPDALVISSVAITNLAANAESLWAYQEFGRLEGERLAQTLDNVAAAYAQVDQQSGEDIGSTFDTPAGAPSGTVFPKGVDLPAPPHPPKMPIPKGQLLSEQGFMDPQSAQTALDAGDDGASLRSAAAMWRTNAQSLAASAEKFEVNSLNWEGQAADAAYAKFNSYREWLVSLSGSWNQLADEADALVTAHSTAKSDHRPIAQRYHELQQQVVENPIGSPAWSDAMTQIAQLQTKSEDVRNTYANQAQTKAIEAEDPPAPVLSGIPVTAQDHQRARPYRPDERAGQGAGGGAGQQSPGGGSGGAPQQAPVSPMSAADQGGQAAQQAAQAAQQAGEQAGQQGGGSPGGGQPGGGQQGGSPGGGMPGTGMPGTGKGGPKLPSDPRLHPAAAGGGGAGSGGSGGGGGGIPGSPLQPAVSAETVAPTPYAASAGPTAAAGTAGSGGVAGAAGGGMGGMAPMHGAHGGGSGEKKRNPQLSQDEELYVEERPHTEPVIGLQPRRRGSDGTRKDS
ncbi:hypothetical protein BST22_00990 [Mycolicibacterium chubuense]|uniref:ESX-1 secretion-associated protein EspB n=1 Tax=Mycolicibacterium chubuense TaxID=1800 RepID=A0A0J6VBI3_MYCCU|nr:PPE domain-containing protein [Mycolicibacterium chubuense]KMO66913.1 ESX-1 secretion-associated protein EspB [Mycolicibacterium chubuense]ORA56546.1 hypothetical protein BST22_00990 [Mycolicibacterium chubuense]SPX99022.1 PPE family protein [Mycolicibacterium chubuense]